MRVEEVLNKLYSEGVGSRLQRKIADAKAFSYQADLEITGADVLFGIEVGDKPVVLRDLDLLATDAKVTLSEGATFSGGTEADAVSLNREIELVNHKDTLSSLTYDQAEVLPHQPFINGVRINRVLNNGNILHPDIAVEVNDLFVDEEEVTQYGLTLYDVPQVDASQGLQIDYISKQSRVAYKREDWEGEGVGYTVGTAKVLASQDWEGEAPTDVVVYNGDNLLTVDEHYEISKYSGNYRIKVLDVEGVDGDLDCIVLYTINELYDATFKAKTDIEFNVVKLPIDNLVGEFVLGGEVTGTEAQGVVPTGTVVATDTGFLYLADVVGVFVDKDSITDGTATADVDGVGIGCMLVALENQSVDETTPITAVVANGTRGAIVEVLSQTKDYTVEDDTGWKITLHDTSVTNNEKDLIVVYAILDLKGRDAGVKLFIAPTVSDAGTTVESWAGRSPATEAEFVLRANTKYVLKASGSAQDVVARLRWFL